MLKHVMITGPRLCACAALLLLFPSRAQGWGQEGHRLIAAIAARHLKPTTAARVKELLAEGETLESISNWADRVRPSRPDTATWHYINLPLAIAGTPSRNGEWRNFCPQSGCVVSAIEVMKEQLRDRSLSRAQRAEALKFLVHFVGDLHQPLHASNSNDRGGNEVLVVYRDRPTNLHSVWDTSLLMDWLGANPGLKTRLEAGPGGRTQRRLARGSEAEWAWESQGIARDLAYRMLPQARPAALGESYLSSTGPVIARQIERAGARLARLLNETLAG